MPSTFTKDDKFVCASNPDIDNNLKFGNTTVFHEGYEKNRQDKVKNICDYIKKVIKKLSLGYATEVKMEIIAANVKNVIEQLWQY